METIPIPFDVSFHFDNHLREVPNSPEDMQWAVKFLQMELATEEDIHQQIYLYGLLGFYARILCDFSLAQVALTSAISLSETLQDERLKTVNQIRLAHLYQWQQRFEESDRLFQELLERCQNHPELESYLDFIYQHMGKSKFDQGRYSEAEEYFRQALTIRLRKGGRELINSTEFALKIIWQKMNHNLANCSFMEESEMNKLAIG